MGRDLGRSALMRPRTLLLAALLTATLASAGLAAPALAVDPTPSPNPGRASSPSVSPPSQQQIDDAKNALDRLRNQGQSAPAKQRLVSGPTADPAGTAGGRSVTSRISDQAWWTLGAGALVLLVASETTRLGVKRAKHRKA